MSKIENLRNQNEELITSKRDIMEEFLVINEEIEQLREKNQEFNEESKNEILTKIDEMKEKIYFEVGYFKEIQEKKTQYYVNK